MHLPTRQFTALQTMKVSLTKLTFHLQSEADSRNWKFASKLLYRR